MEDKTKKIILTVTGVVALAVLVVFGMKHCCCKSCKKTEEDHQN